VQLRKMFPPKSKLHLTKVNFLELSTIWTAEKTKPQFLKRQVQLPPRVWRERHIGILFAKQASVWIFIVLIAPLSAPGDTDEWEETDFKFCTRNSGQSPQDKWNPDEVPLYDLVRKIGEEIDNNGPDHMAEFLIDIFWGWERYFAQIKNDIRGVGSQ